MARHPPDRPGAHRGTAGVATRRTASPAREQALLAEVEALEIRLREVHHRIRGQLQTIASLLSMQADGTRDESHSHALADAAMRILTIASIDDHLRDQPAASAVEMRSAIRALVDLAQQALGVPTPAVTVALDLEPFTLPPALAVSCGLVVNELITNALRHAFVGRPGGRVEVRAGTHDDRVTIMVHDNGIGFAHEWATTAPSGTGLDLVRLLATRQLHGELVIAHTGGTRCIVTFPLPTDAT